ncbi:MAG: NIPSNAP family protein [Saprospiraceae bacterium]|nr:NIPSNAP family protein [Saprospiraceae bacterium]
MKISTSALFLTLLLTIFCQFNSTAQVREFYQIKIYTFETEAQEQATDAYLENAFIPALNRQRIEKVGVFKNRKDTEADSIHKTYVLIPYISLFQYQRLETQLAKDDLYQEAGKDYIDAPFDAPPYQRVESILLKAFEDMPMLKPTTLDGPREDRIYELRSYESATEKIYANKMDMFNAGGEISLFESLDFNAVFYGEVIAGSKMPNLMYMTTHQNQTERDLNWKKFVDSEGWKGMSSLPKYQNNVSHIDIYFLYPTAYSSY